MLLPCHMGSIKGVVSRHTFKSWQQQALLRLCSCSLWEWCAEHVRESCGLPPPAASKAPLLCGTQGRISRGRPELVGRRLSVWSLYIAIAVEKSLVFLRKPKKTYKLCPGVQTLPFSQCRRCMKGITQVNGFSPCFCIEPHLQRSGILNPFLFIILAKNVLMCSISAIRDWQFGSRYTDKSSILKIGFKLPLLIRLCEWSLWCLHADKGFKHRWQRVTRLTSFQQGSVSSEAELSQYFSHDGTSHLPFSDAVTGSCDEEQLRQKNRNSLLDDGSLLPGNLSKWRKCVWSFG